MLDASISFQIFRLLHRLRETFGVTMLFITHSLAAARNLCDRVGVIYRGRLVEEGTAKETIMHPRHPYTKALLDAHPRFGCSTHRGYDTLLDIERPRTGNRPLPVLPPLRSCPGKHLQSKRTVPENA
jgi:ABC-type dipeptide/oligopeptide/nickel transport system ATPase component